MSIDRVVAAVLVAAGLATAGWTVSQGLERFRMSDRTVTVKGLAEREVESDFVVWTLSFRRAGNVFGEVQQALSADRDRVVEFLRTAGIEDAEVEVRPLQVVDVYSREYAQPNQPVRFTGSGQVLVKSPRVTVVAKAALAIDPLIQAGLVIEGGSGPRYQLRGFNEVKAPLLAEATRNAREQAEKFAAEAGAALGRLKSANQGVIRVLDDDGSDMDTSRTPGKRLRVVSTFEFALD